MEPIIYALIALAVGCVVTYLIMRLRGERVRAVLIGERERLVAELEATRNESTRLEDLLSAQVEVAKRLELENSMLSNSVSRLEAEKEAAELRYNELSERCQQTDVRNNTLTNDLSDMRAQYVRLQSEYDALQRQLDEHKKAVEQLNQQMLLQFKTMASDIMDEKTRSFKQMSGESLKTILEPLNRDLEGFRKQVSECYDTENKERSKLQQQIDDLVKMNNEMRREADKLSSALRGGTKVQGDWGEMILLNILQQSGLREGEDFEIQKTVEAAESNKRPDAILHFPNHTDLYIDSKVSFTAYDCYMNATTDEERKMYARQHLDSVYNHVRMLAARDYTANSTKSMEFVIMFMPIESMFMLALDEARASGKNLWNEAYQKRVIIMTPTNLVLAVRMLQDMWRQHRLEANIRAIKERAEKMYSQFVLFATDLDAVRISLDKAVSACSSARNRLTSGRDNLMVQFDKMRSLGIDVKIKGKGAVQSSWRTLSEEAGVQEVEKLSTTDEEE